MQEGQHHRPSLTTDALKRNVRQRKHQDARWQGLFIQLADIRVILLPADRRRGRR
jgi:hypothetical protein